MTTRTKDEWLALAKQEFGNEDVVIGHTVWAQTNVDQRGRWVEARVWVADEVVLTCPACGDPQTCKCDIECRACGKDNVDPMTGSDYCFDCEWLNGGDGR